MTDTMCVMCGRKNSEHSYADTPSIVPVDALVTQLLPCPFCGAPARHVAFLGPLMQWRVRCAQCDAVNDGHHSPADAIAAWNTRAPDPAAYTSGYTAAIERAAEIAEERAEALRLDRARVF